MTEPVYMVRPPGDSFVNALSDHPQKGSIDCAKAREQHQAYVQALKHAKAQTLFLDRLEEFPDSTFVEDTAVFLEGKALLCSMKGSTRSGEVDIMREILPSFLEVEEINSNAHIDGGDVIVTDSEVFVGQSTRTNSDAVKYLADHTSLPITPVPVKKGLHLKTSASLLSDDLMVIYPSAVDPSPFKDFKKIEVSEDEAYAANCLAVNNIILLPEGFPKVQKEIESAGFEVVPLPMSEFEKANGGVTCLSLRIL